MGPEQVLLATPLPCSKREEAKQKLLMVRTNPTRQKRVLVTQLTPKLHSLIAFNLTDSGSESVYLSDLGGIWSTQIITVGTCEQTDRLCG